jgi:hypothetical protein
MSGRAEDLLQGRAETALEVGVVLEVLRWSKP